MLFVPALNDLTIVIGEVPMIVRLLVAALGRGRRL
jgi:hypothetical protein